MFLLYKARCRVFTQTFIIFSYKFWLKETNNNKTSDFNLLSFTENSRINDFSISYEFFETGGNIRISNVYYIILHYVIL